MKRHLATPADIADLNEFRKNQARKNSNKEPNSSGLTKDEIGLALKSLPVSGQKIPEQLIPQLPSD